MKWVFVLLLAVVIFGGAAFFSYRLIVKDEIAVRAEQRADAPPQPTPDFGLNEFRAAQGLKESGKLAQARSALSAFLQRYPTGPHSEKAKDLLGETNVAILLSRFPSPDKTEYVVKKGDVLARVAAKTKSTPELIMRMNNMSGTMLRIGERLLISHPEFSLLLQRGERTLVLLDRETFFKRYHVLEVKLATRQAPKIKTQVAEIMAWKNGRRVGFGSKDYVNSTRWLRLATPGYFLFALPDPRHPNPGVPAPATGVGLAAADLIELSTLVNRKTPVTIID
jgi:hypothetical protein